MYFQQIKLCLPNLYMCLINLHIVILKLDQVYFIYKWLTEKIEMYKPNQAAIWYIRPFFF